MSQCVAFGCKNVNKKGKKPGLSFHRFPSNNSKPEQRKLWAKAVGRENWKPSLYSLLCSDHFKEEDFRQNSEQRKGLKDDAIPSIFPALPKCLQNNAEKSKRKPSAAPYPPKKAKLEGQTDENLPEIQAQEITIPFSENESNENEHSQDVEVENNTNSTQGLRHDHGFYEVPGKNEFLKNFEC